MGAHKLDELWAQCQYYFPRVKEHDVHFSFFRTSFEAHKQQMLDFTDNVERRRSPSRDGGRGHHTGQNPRARMLAEVMARLHSDDQGIGLADASSQRYDRADVSSQRYDRADASSQRYDRDDTLPADATFTRGYSSGSAPVEKE